MAYGQNASSCDPLNETGENMAIILQHYKTSFIVACRLSSEDSMTGNMILLNLTNQIGMTSAYLIRISSDQAKFKGKVYISPYRKHEYFHLHFS